MLLSMETFHLEKPTPAEEEATIISLDNERIIFLSDWGIALLARWYSSVKLFAADFLFHAIAFVVFQKNFLLLFQKDSRHIFANL